MAKKQKTYTYKIWVEIERVPVNEFGEETGDHESGELFGAYPDKVANADSLDMALKVQSLLVVHGKNIVLLNQ